MPQPLFDKKTIYHSALVKAGELEITITCDGPQKSQYQGKDYISFKHDGHEHYYQFENEACGAALSDLKGDDVLILAKGRGDDATIEVLEVNGKAAGRRESREREPRREERREERRDDRGSSRRDDRAPREERSSREQREPTESREEVERKAFRKAGLYGAKCAVLMEMAMRLASRTLASVLGAKEDELLTEDVRALGATLFIEMKGQTDINKLPARFITTKEEPRQEEQRPREERAPERQPGDRASDRHREPERQPDPALDAPEDDIPF